MVYRHQINDSQTYFQKYFDKSCVRLKLETARLKEQAINIRSQTNNVRELNDQVISCLKSPLADCRSEFSKQLKYSPQRNADLLPTI